MSDEGRYDEETGTYTTGHTWDGIEELNTPLPKWWLYILYACIVYAIIYVILFPAIPLVNSATPGVLGQSARGDVMTAIAEHRESQSQYVEQIAAAEFEDIRKSADLMDICLKSGARLPSPSTVRSVMALARKVLRSTAIRTSTMMRGFGVARSTRSITRSATAFGTRDADDPRWSEMPAFGEVLEKEEIADTTQYVLSLSGLDHDATAAARGSELYLDNCSACHGEGGEGMSEMGAPRLNDAIWLFGGTEELIASQIKQPAHGVMPAWGLRLDDATVKSLALYVHGLGGGE